MLRFCLLTSLWLVSGITALAAATPSELRVGIAGHAFDHLGNFGEQAEAAIASGATILYATGLGVDGYSGLPPQSTLLQHIESSKGYNTHSKSHGVQRMLGYVCATSMIGLETFDAHWTPEFRARFKTPPAQWRQQDRQGRPLRSWYEGQYEPACMNHPDWREYERQIVRLQIESGHDGIFFDNPTVHPKGCFCTHCMTGFARFLKSEIKLDGKTVPETSPESIRAWAADHPKEFLRYRATIARDFLGEMRRYARTLNPKALITCNNSLNSPDVLFSQSRSMGYNIFELSKTEDFVVVEDMATQPRTTREGRIFEYGPTYQQLQAISHGKPVVAVTIAEADYHTPARLVRLAMAEAAAYETSYLSWPTWPEKERTRMATEIRPQADFLRSQEPWLNQTRVRRDALLFLPFQQWVHTNTCTASQIARRLTQSNVQYEVLSEEAWTLKNLTRKQPRLPVLICESPEVLSAKETAIVDAFKRRGGSIVFANQPHWSDQLNQLLVKPSVELHGPSTLRAVVRDLGSTTLLHLYNLQIERLSSFEDKVTPAENIRIQCRVPKRTLRSVKALSADTGATSGPIPFQVTPDGWEFVVTFELPRIEISTLVRIE